MSPAYRVHTRAVVEREYDVVAADGRAARDRIEGGVPRIGGLPGVELTDVSERDEEVEFVEFVEVLED